MDIRFYNYGMELQNIDVTITAYHVASKEGTAVVGGQSIHASISLSMHIIHTDVKLDVPYIADVKYNNNTSNYSISLKYVKNPITEIDNAKSHPSWGVATLSKCTSGRTKLFGALAYNGSHYTLNIKNAAIKVDSEDRQYIGNTPCLIAIAFTREQFMNLIIGMNDGSGGATPCTIEYTKEHGTIRYIAEDYNSLEAEMLRISKKWQDDNAIVKQCVSNITRLLSEKQTKAVKEEYETWVKKLNGFINGSMLYNIEHLFEHIEKLVSEKAINAEPAREPDNKIELIRDLRNATGCLLADAAQILKDTNYDYSRALRWLKERN